MKEYCESCGCKFDGENVIRSKSYRNRCRSCVATQTRQKRAGNAKRTDANWIIGKSLNTAEKELHRVVMRWLKEFDRLEYDAAGDIWGWKDGEAYKANIRIEIIANADRAIVKRITEDQ